MNYIWKPTNDRLDVVFFEKTQKYLLNFRINLTFSFYDSFQDTIWSEILVGELFK